MKYYEVIPLSYIGKNVGLLTYSANDVLEFGEIVEVPVRGKNIKALVKNCVDKPDFNTKEINKKLYPVAVITKEQYKIAEWISSYYLAPIHLTLGLFIPSGIGKTRRATKNTETTNKPEVQHMLTNDQKAVFDSIKVNTENPHLIHGVTGSGKTEIYLQTIDYYLKMNKGAIYLVPEIALTPQTISRIKERFGNLVGLVHSKQLETEKFQVWEKAMKGEIKIVVGPRSALFMPVQDLGVIVIDECHESSYKQDQTPRYEAVKTAEYISKSLGASLLLGSATPTVEQYHKAKTKVYILDTLNTRIVQDAMPTVEIVDMRNEFKYGNKSVFSEKLQQEIKEVLKTNDQVLLFINRRGMSTFVSCRDCGYVENCPNCSVPLTFHYSEMTLKCHHCGHKKLPETSCPKCKSLAIKYFGSGTEKIENEITKIFGKNVSVVRMDSDTTKKTGSHSKIFNEIKSGKYQIIIGTQMITKGWDLPNVRLVGAISADNLFNKPDFSNDERAFGLLTQVAGRTGRGYHPGKAIIQTYNPDNPIIANIKNHDYKDFYNDQIKTREDLGYPPFANLVKLLYNNKDNQVAADTMNNFVIQLKENFGENIKIIGPSPAFIPKINNIYKFQIILKISNTEIEKIKTYLINNLNEDWSIDVDPAGTI